MLKNLFFIVFCWFGRCLLSLRYRVEIRGRPKKSDFQKNEGTLFLANHPANIDPLILIFYFWQHFKMRPLSVEYVYRQKVVHFFLTLIRTIPIPNFDTTTNEIKVKRAEASIKKIIEGLQKKDAFLIYPGARLKSSGKEIVGGSSATHHILEESPNANVILVRTTGLWGSSFSRALENNPPSIRKTFLKGFKILLKNFIFFSPRRKVLVEFEVNPKFLPKKASRIDFNRSLEGWFNQYPVDGKRIEEEPLSLVSYSIFSEELPSLEKAKTKQKKEAISKEIPQKNRDMILGELSKLSKVPVQEIHDDMSLSTDLALDSLNFSMMVVYISQHFEIGEVTLEEMQTVRDLLELSQGKDFNSIVPEEINLKYKWPKETSRKGPFEPSGKTLMEAFLKSCDQMGDSPAIADNFVGVFSYPKLRRAVVVLASEFQKYEETNVGVLLPASASAFIIVFALMLAGKVPVLMNWTLGRKFLDEVLEVSNVKVVISSWSFIENLSNVEFGRVVDSIKYIEDIKDELSFRTKFKGLFLSKKSTDTILKSFSQDQIKEDSTALILFTSGSESFPKGVPLSHKNLISNLAACHQSFIVDHRDILLGILPPFHSFGFTTAGIYSILSGLKIAFSPDPTDSLVLAKDVDKWKPTFFLSPPIFLKKLLLTAKKEELASVRIFVLGAEKPSKELYEKVEALGEGKRIVEGYGITEYSPVISLNRFDKPSIGVGEPIPGIEVCTIHHETKELLPKHAEGEICVRGPGIFKGYLGNPKSPFILIEGEEWYSTGDIGYLDDKGVLHLSGRLKRFVKIGGEMISLVSIESVFIASLKGDEKKDQVPYVAICSDDREVDRPKLILFTTRDLTLEDANELLIQSGVSKLARLSEVKKLEQIPLIGPGKIDYQTLKKSSELSN